MDCTRYKVKHYDHVGDLWTIEGFRFGDYICTLEIEFTDQETANKVCKILNEEVKEAYGDGQASTY